MPKSRVMSFIRLKDKARTKNIIKLAINGLLIASKENLSLSSFFKKRIETKK